MTALEFISGLIHLLCFLSWNAVVKGCRKHGDSERGSEVTGTWSREGLKAKELHRCLFFINCPDSAVLL